HSSARCLRTRSTALRILARAREPCLSGGRLRSVFFKQKTAYELATYWSSDVCSSDLRDGGAAGARRRSRTCDAPGAGRGRAARRSEERRVGKECRSRRAPELEKKDNHLLEGRRCNRRMNRVAWRVALPAEEVDEFMWG